MSLAEIMAKKRAAALLPPTQPQPVEESSFVASINEIITPPNIIKEEVAITQIEKPMSFAERMALKVKKEVESPKAQAVSTLAPVVTAPTVSIPAQVDTTTQWEQNTEIETTPEIEQAYADISRRIEALTALSDTDLENAMTELKVALLTNPNAVLLMEDTDYGKMVIAIKIIVKEAAADALKEKSGGKKSKSKLSLSPEDVAAAFEEI